MTVAKDRGWIYEKGGGKDCGVPNFSKDLERDKIGFHHPTGKGSERKF